MQARYQVLGWLLPMQIDGLGIVAIGRNEGARLRTCLASCLCHTDKLVYVDSGSSDGSVELAKTLGARVVELDLNIPFTAARARNAGAAEIQASWPDIAAIHFIDGDCELFPHWLSTATRTLSQNPRAAIVCGRRRERAPRRSVYNLLCEMEWDTPVGRVDACGGDALIRTSAFNAVGGYRGDLIAGEEPEMCLRLRRGGWEIHRIDQDMTMHDADMHHFRQWWRRAMRSGYAYAEGRGLHGNTLSGYCAREVASTLFWGPLFPAVAVILATVTQGYSLSILALYPLQWWRIRRGRLKRGNRASDASIYAAFCLLAKLPETAGIALYWLRRLRGVRPRLIEYKIVNPPAPRSEK